MTPDSADTAGAGGSTDPPDSLRPRMTFNGYSLELGGEPGMLISEVAEPTSSEARPLAEALEAARAEPRPQGAITERLSQTIEDASEVTSRAERAVSLFRAVAEGRVLDPDQLVGEVDALLDLLDRLDEEGRYKEALDLARSLSGLLALLMRWAELAHSLRLALRAAEAVGDMPGVAFVKHQLGTLELVAGDTRAAERNLGEAREIRQRLGDRRALAATGRNLQFLCQQLRDMLRKGRLQDDREDSGFLRRRVIPADPRPHAEFRCADPPGGSGIAFCRATDEDGRRVANGDALNVGVGSHTLTIIAADTARRAVTYEISRGGRPECRDRADNDDDGLRDGKDPGCSDGTEAPADRATECADNRDNDRDGAIDASDPGCGDGTEADAEPPPVEGPPPVDGQPNSEQPVP